MLGGASLMSMWIGHSYNLTDYRQVWQRLHLCSAHLSPEMVSVTVEPLVPFRTQGIAQSCVKLWRTQYSVDNVTAQPNARRVILERTHRP